MIKTIAPRLSQIVRIVTEGGASLRFKALGSSMSPFIRNGDVVTISPVPHESLGPGDIAAFTMGEQLLLHRVIALQGDYLLVRGDNATSADGFIARNQVLGRVSSVERRGRRVRLGFGPERRLIAFCSRHSLTAKTSKTARTLRSLCLPQKNKI